MKNSFRVALRCLSIAVVLAGPSASAGAQAPYLVKDIAPGSANPALIAMQDAGGTLFFCANGRPWRSDGTAAGTFQIKDVLCWGFGYDETKYAGVRNGIFYFAGSSGDGLGQELWRSDGTEAGTFLVKDLRPGPNGSSPREFLNVGGTLFFWAITGGTPGPAQTGQLWKTDGTPAGTVVVKDIDMGNNSTEPTAAGALLFFVLYDSAGYELWRSDGTTTGTFMVQDIRPGADSSAPEYLTAVGNTLFFRANDGTNGAELWRSDGTPSGTFMVKDINPSGGSLPWELVNVAGTLFFSAATSALGDELWKSDGTSAGTVLVKDVHAGFFGSNISGMAAVGGRAFFYANDGTGPGDELWTSNGTSGGTQLVKDINPSGNSTPLAPSLHDFMFRDLNGLLVFNANDGTTGTELWRSDGSGSGTVRLGDIRPGSQGSEPRYATRSGERLFFTADDGVNGRELWAVLAPVTLSIDDRTVAEGSAVNAAFRVFLSGASTSTVTVQYATANNTAIIPGDYTATSGTLSFSPGRTQHSIFVPIASDSAVEGSETFFVNLSNPANAVLGSKTQGIGTITDPPAAAKAAMYRSYNKSTDYHFFTTDLSSKDFAVNVLGFQDESNPIPFYVWNVMQSGTTPLFRMYNPNLGRHFYTASSGSRDFIMGIGGLYEKEEGFVYPLSTSPVPSGATELFLLYNNNSGTHLFTADANQKNAILTMFPGVWVQHTSVGYVFTSP